MANFRPPSGTMVWWRMRSAEPKPYHFGYCTYESSYNMVRMGCWNGDTTGGYVVDIADIDWKPYNGH